MPIGENTSNIYNNLDLVQMALASSGMLNYPNIGEETPTELNINEVKPSTPIKPSPELGSNIQPYNTNNGGDSQRNKGLLENNRGPYAFEPEYWGGKLPSNMQNTSLWNDIKSSFKSASPYLGVFGSMLTGGPLGMMASIPKAFNKTPLDDPTVRQGFQSLYNDLASTGVQNIYGSTPEEFDSFLNGIFGKRTGFSVSDIFSDEQAQQERAWGQITPQVEQLAKMVGLEQATPEFLDNLRMNAIDTVRSVAIDMQSYSNPSLLGFQDISKLNNSYIPGTTLTPPDLTKMTDLAHQAGMPSTNISYVYKQNPTYTEMMSNKAAKGDISAAQELASKNATLGYYDASRELNTSYQTGEIDFNTWGQEQLGLKGELENTLQSINEGNISSPQSLGTFSSGASGQAAKDARSRAESLARAASARVAQEDRAAKEAARSRDSGDRGGNRGRGSDVGGGATGSHGSATGSGRSGYGGHGPEGTI